MPGWNPWHGCIKVSAGCQNCYVYRTDAKYDKDSSKVTRTANFDLPVRKNRNGEYKLKNTDTIYTCFTSDFLLAEADEWRAEAWKMIRERRDLKFFFITKRIERFTVNLPEDWGNGYDNVAVGCTCENQDRADYRLPVFLSLPIKNRFIICEPLLEKIDLSQYLFGNQDKIERVAVGGESGASARLCDYDWVLDIRRQCVKHDIPFWFKQTGARFKANGKVYNIERKYQHSQARKANINYRY